MRGFSVFIGAGVADPLGAFPPDLAVLVAFAVGDFSLGDFSLEPQGGGEAEGEGAFLGCRRR